MNKLLPALTAVIVLGHLMFGCCGFHTHLGEAIGHWVMAESHDHECGHHHDDCTPDSPHAPCHCQLECVGKCLFVTNDGPRYEPDAEFVSVCDSQMATVGGNQFDIAYSNSLSLSDLVPDASPLSARTGPLLI